MGTKNLTIDELRDFADLADKAYQNWIPKNPDEDNSKKNSFSIGDKTYTVVDVLNDEETGAYAFLAEDNQGNKYLVFRGTEKDGLNIDFRDVEDDVELSIFGTTPEQLESVQNWINSLAERGLIKPEDNVISVGHSLGGYLADAATLMNNHLIDNTYIFNAPGYSSNPFNDYIDMLSRIAGRDISGTFDSARSKILEISSLKELFPPLPIDRVGEEIYGDKIYLPSISHSIKDIIETLDLLKNIGINDINDLKDYMNMKLLTMKMLEFMPINFILKEIGKSFIALLSRYLLLRAVYGDPLVVDLDGDGIETIGLDSSNAMFDLDGDGFREKTGWVSKRGVANQTVLLLN